MNMYIRTGVDERNVESETESGLPPRPRIRGVLFGVAARRREANEKDHPAVDVDVGNSNDENVGECTPREYARRTVTAFLDAGGKPPVCGIP